MQEHDLAFTILGSNFKPGATVVNFTNSTYGTVTTTLSSVSSTKITGNATFLAMVIVGGMEPQCNYT